MAKRHKCERCGAYMAVTVIYPDHVNLYCPKCGYRDTYPKLNLVTEIKIVKRKGAKCLELIKKNQERK